METKTTILGRKVVRVVARVRPSTDPVIQVSTKSICVHKPKGDESETVSISFAGSKDSCKLDYCYEENETTGLIFTREIKPLISTVFEGKNANIIAHGARGSGKTHLIQGLETEHGLIFFTMAEMLSMAEERGDTISISIYEVSQETVYDILDPEKRVVSILEGAQGKIQLKGLSQVTVKSLSEFQNLYFGLKKFQKLTGGPPLRSHKGVMIHVITSKVNSGSLGRMNFLDMAGYEDSRKQNSDLAPLETTRINKSIYALQNVMYALNANESHVPYRESKLTRMLKDCLQGRNKTLLITCLPREFNQDSFYLLKLASRICLGSNQAMPTKKNNCLPRSITASSAPQKRHTPLVVSTTSKKQTELRGNVIEKKTIFNTTSTPIKGRKLFGESNYSVKCKTNTKKVEGKARIALKKKISPSKTVSSTKEEVCSSSSVTEIQSSMVEKENSALDFSSSIIAMEPGYLNNASFSSEVVDTTTKETPQKHEETFSGATTSKVQIEERDDKSSVIEEDLTLVDEGVNSTKENNSLLANETTPSPLKLRLQKFSESLKSMLNSPEHPFEYENNQTALTKSQEGEISEHSEIIADVVVNVEQKTPERIMPSNIEHSPWKTFSAHSSKLKKSAVGEYLKFLNTAEKEDLKKLKGIGEKRATYIVELREESPEPFKMLDDLKYIGLSEKQIKGMLKKEIGHIFH